MNPDGIRLNIDEQDKLTKELARSEHVVKDDLEVKLYKCDLTVEKMA